MVKESFPVFLSSSIAFSMTSLKESTLRSRILSSPRCAPSRKSSAAYGSPASIVSLAHH